MTQPSSIRLRALVLGPVAALALVAATPAPAAASGVFWKKADLLRSFFGDSDKVTYKRFDLTESQRKTLRKRLGYAPQSSWTVFYGLKDGVVQGYAVVDEERGQHRPITFGVLIDTRGRAQQVEVLVYRENHGEQIRQERFRRQFRGRTARDPMVAGRDIVTVSGATISSRSMTTGVRRALAVVDELIIRPHLELAGR